MTLSLFQSTRPRGARRAQPIAPPPSLSFNPRAHAGRDDNLGDGLSDRVSFNPRAHAGRDLKSRPEPDASDVSIHAPTRGATIDLLSKSTDKLFQSTRPRGARHAAGGEMTPTTGFNPRAHAGRDPSLPPLAARFGVSIHAPTRGATSNTPSRPTKRAVSIHAPTRGATPAGAGYRGGLSFNPRAHAGRDRPCPTQLSTSCRFNPRAHAGRDHSAGQRLFTSMVSIHAPTRGATTFRAFPFRLSWFQSTRPRGARPFGPT